MIERVALIGCYGYGNHGDDMLGWLLAEQLKSLGVKHVSRHNSNLPADGLPPADLAIVGPGGVLMACPGHGVAHFNAMSWYLRRYREQGVPIGFIGCGFQYPKRGGEWWEEGIPMWAEHLKVAAFGTFRSAACRDKARELAPGNAANMHYFPDLGYSAPQWVDVKKAEISQPTLVLVPNTGGFSNAPNQNLRNCIKSLMHTWMWAAHREQPTDVWMARRPLVKVLRMGAVGDDQSRLVELRQMASSHPKYTVLNKNGGFMVHNTGTTFRDAVGIIANASLVVSERFHGYVLARAFGVPTWTSDDPGIFKLWTEDRGLNPSDAIGHLHVLRNFIKGS